MLKENDLVSQRGRFVMYLPRRSALSLQVSALLKTTYLYIHRAPNCGPWHGPMLEISPESPLESAAQTLECWELHFGELL